ncbi:MAG: hypothetical protein MJ252_28445 [archaeon]|nr:hypothetical protein [archaeon]
MADTLISEIDSYTKETERKLNDLIDLRIKITRMMYPSEFIASKNEIVQRLFNYEDVLRNACLFLKTKYYQEKQNIFLNNQQNRNINSPSKSKYYSNFNDSSYLRGGIHNRFDTEIPETASFSKYKRNYDFENTIGYIRPSLDNKEKSNGYSVNIPENDSNVNPFKKNLNNESIGEYKRDSKTEYKRDSKADSKIEYNPPNNIKKENSLSNQVNISNTNNNISTVPIKTKEIKEKDISDPKNYLNKEHSIDYNLDQDLLKLKNDYLQKYKREYPKDDKKEIKTYSVKDNTNLNKDISNNRYPKKEYSIKDYQNEYSNEYKSKEFPKQYSNKEYFNKENSLKDFSYKDYSNKDISSKDIPRKDYGIKDFNNSTKDFYNPSNRSINSSNTMYQNKNLSNLSNNSNLKNSTDNNSRIIREERPVTNAITKKTTNYIFQDDLTTNENQEESKNNQNIPSEYKMPMKDSVEPGDTFNPNSKMNQIDVSKEEMNDLLKSTSSMPQEKIKSLASRIAELVMKINADDELNELLNNLFKTNVTDQLLSSQVTEEFIENVEESIEEIEKLRANDSSRNGEGVGGNKK